MKGSMIFFFCRFFTQDKRVKMATLVDIEQNNQDYSEQKRG
ncbi:Uncharacterised protein [Klebsiella pneumoniae subsp. pneumoniae]|nr:Uncharacterised protein [Klebsiella pneumoniae subsp. pneumoniae]